MQRVERIVWDVLHGFHWRMCALTERQGKHIENAQAPFFSRQRELITDVHCAAWSVMSERECVYFLGSRFDTGSIEDAVFNILAETRGHFKYVVTPNVHHMVRLHEDPATMQPLFERAWRVFCDSRVLSRLARFSGVRLPVITGSDLTARLIARAGEQRLTIAIVGPTAAACAALKEYPGLNIVFTRRLWASSPRSTRCKSASTSLSRRRPPWSFWL